MNIVKTNPCHVTFKLIRRFKSMNGVYNLEKHSLLISTNLRVHHFWASRPIDFNGLERDLGKTLLVLRLWDMKHSAQGSLI